MNQREDLTSLEALGLAIRGLMDAQEVYKNLADKCENDLLRDRILNLYSEEKKHQQLLEAKYKEMFPNVELMLPESKIPKDLADKSICSKLKAKDILQLAIDEHKSDREYYLDFAESVQELSGKRMFRFLADMKFSHQMMLMAELEMIEKYPSYFEEQKSWDVEGRLKAERIRRHD